jgi:SAM-dependent methyltransferase
VRDSSQRDHYSYTVYRDPETARTFDDRRFGGPIGEIVADAQARVITSSIEPLQGRRILDVGTGTGRAALLLARGAAVVTAVDASEQMLAVARERAASQGLSVRFQLGDAHALDFPDRAFDVVISLRVLMHTPDWRQVVGELCRVADALVIFDYPAKASLAIVQAGVRRVTHVIGLRTEPYRVLGQTQIVRELTKAGYRVRSLHRQFVLPITLHKAIGSRRFTLFVERLLARVGLLSVLGSPVTLVAERCVYS